MLTRDEILSRDDLPVEPVELPGLGTAHVRPMTGSERDRFDAENAEAKGADISARLAAYSLCDEAGKLLFAPADVPALGRRPATVLTPIVAAAVRINRMGRRAAQAGEDGQEGR